MTNYNQKSKRDFPVSPLVKTVLNVVGMGSISGQGTKIPRATRFSHKILLINHKMQVKCSLSFISCSGKRLNLKGRGLWKPPTL